MAEFRVFSVMDHPDWGVTLSLGLGSTLAAAPPALGVFCSAATGVRLSAGDCEMQRRNTNVSFLIWDPVEGKRSAVCFPLQREDTFSKSDGRVYFLHVGGRGTQDGFYPLPGNGKVSRRPLCRGKGKLEMGCEAKRGED